MPPIRSGGDVIGTTESRRWAALLVAISGVALLAAGAPLAGGVLGALVLAVVLETPYRALARRVGPRGAAALLSVSSLLVLFVPALVIGRLSWLQFRGLDWEGLGNAWSRNTVRGGSDLPSVFTEIVPRVAASVASAVGDVASWVAGSAAHSALNLLVMFLCLYFVLGSGDALWTRARALLPFSVESSEMLRADLRRVTKATVLGTLLSAVLQGMSMTVGFLIAGVPAPVLWGVATIFASMVPVVGSALVWVPAVVVLALRHATGAALVVVGFGWFLPTAIDTVTRATVSRRYGNVHPLTTLLGALIGIPMFGIVGLVIGPLMIATVIELLDLYHSDYGGGDRGPRDAASLLTVPVVESAP
jgi:predicted PurR-regulated permease PerM